MTLFIAAWFLIAKKYRRSSKLQMHESHTDQQADQHLTELEQRLARHGLERLAGETLLQFAQRIAISPAAGSLSSVIDWYQVYGVIRYDDQRDLEGGPVDL